MKKITAFFMALMPLLVTILLFAAGLIVKNSTHVYVTSVELPQQSVPIKVEDTTKEKTYQMEANVLPHNATNPKVKWTTSDVDGKILTINNEGLVTCKDYGEAYVYATSEENPTLASAAKVDIYDTVIHEINVANQYDASYVGIDEEKKLDISTKPSMTHIVNQTLKFEVTEGKDVVKTTMDGTILPQKEGTAKIKITSDDEKSKAAKEITVNVGKGVNVLSLDNPADEITSGTNYNLFDHIETAPEKIDRTASIMDNDASKINATDFTYTSSNEQIALVDEQGRVSFQLPGTATFTITYKRNPKLKVTKKIESTCSQLKQVFFTNGTYELPVTATNEQLNNLVDWYAYPYNGTKTKEVEGVEIISSDENVVKAIPGNGSYSLEIKGVGSTTLTALIKVNETTYKTDSCQVNILLPESEIFEQPSVVTDSCYYPLRKNIKYLKDIKSQYPLNKLTFSLDYLEQNAELIENEILFIKDPTKDINVNVEWTKQDGTTVTGTFTVKASNAQTVAKDFSKTLVIPAGQITKINGWTPIWDSKAYAEKFATINDGFVAKCGQSIDEFEIIDTKGNKDTIKLIVTEDPLYIASSSDALYSTNEYEVDFKNTIAPKVLPSTATKEDGSKYILTTAYYDKIGSGAAKVEDNVITYSAPGTMSAITKCSIDSKNYLQQEYTIVSTYGDTFGRFEIQDKDGNKVNSYKTFTLNPADTTQNSLTLYCPSLKWATFNNMQIKSTTGLCSVSKEWSGLVLTGHAEFTIKVDPATKKYGTDVIEISSSVFSVFIYINVSPFVTDISLTKAGVELDDTKANKTYTTNLKIKAQVSPCVVADPGLTAKFNGETYTISEGIITLPDSSKWVEGDNNTLTVSAAGGFEKQIKFNYSKQDPKFELEGCEEGYLYLTSNATQKVCKVVTDGFVDDSWYSSLECKLDKEEHGEQIDIGKYLTVYGIKLPEAENYEPYTNKLDVWVKGKQTQTKKTYQMGRDFVSRIEFPGHDNTDMTDKKGLQKVHVYGNKSFYKEDMKEVDYYKLPVKLYGFDHQEIKNTEKYPETIITVLNTLKASFGNSNSTYKFTNDGYIEIHFHKDDLYTFDEIKNDAFDSKQNKNVTFSLSTWSNEAKVQYTFVAVESINQYCQEGLLAISNGTASMKSNVFQTNFGLNGVTKDNTELTNPDVERLYEIYGNGYTLQLDDIATKKHQIRNDANIDVAKTLNLTANGSSAEEMKKEGKTSEYYVHPELPGDRVIKYSTIKNFTQGMNLTAKDHDVYMQKSLFRSNKLGVFFMDGTNQNKIYLEDIVMFDTAGMPILGLKSNLHIKGFMDVYNFHGKEVLQNLPGIGDLSGLWPIIESIGREKDMLNRGADGRTYVNTFCMDILFEIKFYNKQTGQYELSEHGLPGSGQYLSKFINLGLPGTKYIASLWATPNAETHSGAPSYYDEFDKDGNLRLDFLYNQLNKITREIKYF